MATPASSVVPVPEDISLIAETRYRLESVAIRMRAPYDRELDWEYQRANLDAYQRLG